MRGKKIKKNKKKKRDDNEEKRGTECRDCCKEDGHNLKKILSGFLLQAWSAKTRGLLLISDQVVRSCS